MVKTTNDVNQSKLVKIENSVNRIINIISEEQLSHEEICLMLKVIKKIADNETIIKNNSLKLCYETEITNIGYVTQDNKFIEA